MILRFIFFFLVKREIAISMPSCFNWNAIKNMRFQSRFDYFLFFHKVRASDNEHHRPKANSRRRFAIQNRSSGWLLEGMEIAEILETGEGRPEAAGGKTVSGFRSPVSCPQLPFLLGDMNMNLTIKSHDQ